MQAGIHGRLVTGFTGGGNAQGLVQELVGAAGGLLLVEFLERIRQFQQGFQPSGLGHHQVAEVAGQGAHEMEGVEALGQDFVKGEEGLGVVAREEVLHQLEAVLVVQYSQVADNIFVFYRGAAEGHRLVKDGEGVAHGAIGLGGYLVQGFVVYGDAFLLGNAAKVFHHVRDADAVEIVCLAAAQDGGQDLVLFRGGQDEDGVCRRLFQGFEEGVEGTLGQHMHLVYDVHAVLAHLRRHLHLLHQGFDVLHGVVGGGIQLVDAVASPFLEADAGLALSARFHLRPGMGTVDHLGEDTRRGGFTHAPGPAEKVCVRQLPPPDGVGKGARDGVLADQGFEGVRPVLPCRYDVVAHRLQR